MISLQLFGKKHKATFPIVVGLVVFLSFLSPLYAQTWGANSYSPTANEALDVETTSSGQSYVTGYFSGQTSFGTLYSFSASNGNTDAYVVKYDANGAIIWLKQFGGTSADKGIDLAIGPDQNIVVTGSFFGSVTFGSTTLTSTSNSKDIFIVKLDPSGNVIWARKEGGDMADDGYKLTVDHQNNVILTGQYQGTATIGSNSFTSLTDPDTGLPSYDLFVAKYNPSGTPLWSITGHAIHDDRGLSVAVDNTDNIYLTGQFSDNLDFGGNTYTNSNYNVGYLCKMNSSGQIQFFNMMKAGQVVPYEVEINQNNESIVIGDFLGNMTYYHQSGNSVVQNPYDKQIFTIKTNNSGQYVWNNTLGSDNEISARSLAIDPGNNIFVTGYFLCDLSQLQDTTENLFNSVGFKDPYLMKINNSGGRVYIKHFGGQQDDEGKGVSAYQTEKPFVCGSYTSDLNFMPGSGATVGSTNYSFNPFFGSEPYHIFLIGDPSRNSFLESHVNINYGNYNYFTQPTSDSLVGHLTAYQIPEFVYVINDTVHFCATADLNYDPLTYNHLGPLYDYHWSNGSTNPQITVSATGNYWIRTDRRDQCTFDIDTIYAIHEPSPTMPLLTDDHGVNVATPGPEYNDYHFCSPESVTLTFSGLDPGSSMVMTGPTQTYNGVGPHIINSELQYNVHVENQYCSKDGEFVFDLDFTAPPETISPEIVMYTDSPGGDSITICAGDAVLFHGIDLLHNNHHFVPQIEAALDTVLWEINGVGYLNNDTASTIFAPTTSGWYTVKMTAITGYNNLCGIDTSVFIVTHQFYVNINPLPTWVADINGTSLLCPGEAAYLVAENPNPSLHWIGPPFLWTNGMDSILVNSPGYYTYAGTIEDSITHCTLDIIFNHYVGIKVAPLITCNQPEPIICPNDSLQLSLPNFYSGFLWIAPNGDTLSETSICYVHDIGLYSCIVTDTSGCQLTTDFFEVYEYSTPAVTADPDNVICSGNQVITLTVTASGSASFHWLVNGASTESILVNQPGTYYVEITQCGVTVLDSIVVYSGLFNLSQIYGDSLLCGGEAGIFFVDAANTGADVEWFSNGTSLGSDNPITIPYSQLLLDNQISVNVSNACHSQTLTDSVILIAPFNLLLSDDTLRLCPNDSEIVSVSNSNIDSISWSAPFTNVHTNQVTIAGGQVYPNIDVVAFDTDGCSSNTATIVVENTDHTFSTSIDFNNFCPGAQGSVSVTTNSDSAIWTTPFGIFNTNTLSYTLNENTSGTHIIQTWDTFGCLYVDSISVLVAHTPNTNLLPDSVFCLNDIYTFNFPNDTNTYSWLNYGNNTSIAILSDQDLILQIITPQGCTFYDTLFVETIDCSNPLPNVITPNGDADNDYFFIDDAISQLKNEIVILNRWGEMVYEASPYQNKFNGEGLSEGVYFYLYYPLGKEKPELVRQGFLHLIR